MSTAIDRVDNAFPMAALVGASQQTLVMASSLVSLIDLRDQYTHAHSGRVAAYSREIALKIGLAAADIEQITLAAALHDIGKAGIPDNILLKKGPLSEDEFKWIRKHPELGWMAVRSVEGFQSAGLQILHHHERWDGNGYPGNLRGNEIPLGSSIIAVADSFDALTTERPYRKATTKAEALCEICRLAGTQFSPDVVRAFCDSMSR